MAFILTWLMYLSFATQSVLCQTTSTTTGSTILSDSSDPNLSVNGNFTYPSGLDSWFDQGNSMVIQWEAPYTNINLYYIWRGNRSIELSDRQCLIASGIPNNSKDWVVSCAIPPNCNTDICTDSSEGPFALRAVNTHGTGDDQTLGGFFSDEFYIRPKPSPSSSSSSTLSSTSSTASSSSTTSSSVTSSAPASTESTTTTSSSTTTSSVPATTDLPLATSQTSQPAPNTKPDESGNGLAIGIGVGAGTAVALLVGGGAFFLWRRHRRKQEKKKVSWPIPVYPENYNNNNSNNNNSNNNVVSDQKPECYMPTQPAAEAPVEAAVVEAPAREPQELPARSSRW